MDEGDGTDGVPTDGLTVMVTVFEVAGLPVTHVALDVSMHSTASPFNGV